MGFGIFDLMEGLFPIFFAIVFVIVIGSFVLAAVRGASQWNKNNHSPVLTVRAKLVGKREKHSSKHYNDPNGLGHTMSSTDYYLTFEVQSGDRMEFCVSGREYGLLAEGDCGELTFQGTRYHGFRREKNGEQMS